MKIGSEKMSILFDLFTMFFKLGFFSFGGGYAMIPLIENELVNKGILLEPEVISNITAIAGLSPGPVGVNSAVAFGYQIDGIPGVVASFLGIVAPSLIIVILVASIFERIYNSKLFKWALDGLRPIIVGIIAYGAISMAMKNGMFFAPDRVIESGIYIGTNSLFEIKSILLACISLTLLIKTKIHPIILIGIGAICGVVAF